MLALGLWPIAEQAQLAARDADIGVVCGKTDRQRLHVQGLGDGVGLVAGKLSILQPLKHSLVYLFVHTLPLIPAGPGGLALCQACPGFLEG